LATARGPGFTTITATSGDRSGSTTLTVADGTPVTRFTLSVVRQGTGSGTVTSDDGLINCGGGGACSASYDSGSRVILRARAGWLSSFDGWSGGGCSGTGDCVVTLGEDTMVTARFRLLGLF